MGFSIKISLNENLYLRDPQETDLGKRIIQHSILLIDEVGFESFNFKKLTIQEVTLVGTYCYTNKDFKETLNILNTKKLGDLGWIEYRDLKKGSEAFKEIHDGSCVAPKIILTP